MLACPFCGAPETDRFDLEGQRFLVFRCLFTPAVDPKLTEEEVTQHLARDYGPEGSGYFRKMCDRLHLYVTKGAGAQALGASEPVEPAGPR
ncbi:MAG: hypothetical protein ACLQD9_02465 [Thermoplasmata archaeon]|nr:hypothetical protein [Thermoplasmata archaeon]